MTPCHCKDYTRSAILREAAAKAGGGLRAIEPGMPLPAGTGLSRRAFLARSSGLALAVFGGSALAPAAWDEGIGAAAAAAPDAPVVVSVFMSGGADSLSMLAPVGDSRYASLRPTLALPDSADVFAEDARLRWHPQLAPIRDLHAAGKVTVIPAIGYDHPNQSHFTSRHFWEVGELNPLGRIGWMGRYLDRHGAPDNPLQGLSLDYSLAPSLAAGTVPVAAVGAPESYRLWTRDVWNIEAQVAARYGALGALAEADPELAGARTAVRQTIALQQQLRPLASRSPAWAPPGTYPSGTFARRLAVLAELLGMGLPLRCVALDAHGGYDTHDGQAGSLPGMLGLFAQSLAAFQADLEGRGLADRVVVHVWSEFGRRPQQNGSGTDHGAAGLSLLIGTQVRGQMIGEFPGLATLDAQGNLRNTSDFRHVYKHIVQDWLGVDATGIVPDAAAFSSPLALFK
jgi:uncharacterized protein (DUF1501 family)